MAHSSFSQVMGLPPNQTDEVSSTAGSIRESADIVTKELGQAISTAIKEATNQDDPQVHLQAIYHAVSQHGKASLLVRRSILCRVQVFI